jgi:hypothetical protein
MNYAQARLWILVPLQIGRKLLIKESGESTSRNTQQRSDETIMSGVGFWHLFDHLQLWGRRTASARLPFLLGLALMLVCLPVTSLAQPAALTPPQLDQLVARIALYPGPFACAGTHRFDLLERDS